PTVIGALALKRGEAEAIICGLKGHYENHLTHISDIIGKRPGIRNYSALSALIMQGKTIFFADTHVSFDPSSEEIAGSTVMAAKVLRSFGIIPRVALLSHSNFGSRDTESSLKMREALSKIRRMSADLEIDLEIDGEMQGEYALSDILCRRAMPNTSLTHEANLLIFPNIDSANIALGIAKSISDGLQIGPILLGAALPAYVLSPSITARGIVDMVALAVAENFSNIEMDIDITTKSR
ncbi:phosphate acyltransferase, partial [Candidatus Liberibacter sp.]|uniref:phosphate acyltransferase n=1 Tax=Candidatus Liberibacter sp. TaxID=34022 RepID=UPI0017901A51